VATGLRRRAGVVLRRRSGGGGRETTDDILVPAKMPPANGCASRLRPTCSGRGVDWPSLPMKRSRFCKPFADREDRWSCGRPAADPRSASNESCRVCFESRCSVSTYRVRFRALFLWFGGCPAFVPDFEIALELAADFPRRYDISTNGYIKRWIYGPGRWSSTRSPER